MKYLAFILFFLTYTVKAQKFESDSARLAQPTFSFDVMICPLLYYNGIALGAGILNKGNEHVLDANANYLPIGAEQFSIGLHYNYNRYIITSKENFLPYIPFWIGAVRRNVDNNYEDGGPYYDRLILRVGSGFGASFLFKSKHYLRAEFGAGLGLNHEDLQSYDNESAFPFRMNLSRFGVSNDQPITPAFRLRLRYQFINKL